MRFKLIAANGAQVTNRDFMFLSEIQSRWPDWANYRLLGGCILWAKILRTSPIFLHFFNRQKLSIFYRQFVGLQFRFHLKLIWSPWIQRKNMARFYFKVFQLL
jgi:hypothetical protein